MPVDPEEAFGRQKKMHLHDFMTKPPLLALLAHAIIGSPTLAAVPEKWHQVAAEGPGDVMNAHQAGAGGLPRCEPMRTLRGNQHLT